MLAESCRTSAEGRVRRALQALALIILTVTLACSWRWPPARPRASGRTYDAS